MAPRTRTVVVQHRLSETLTQLDGNRTGQDIGRPTRCEGDDHAYGLLWVVARSGLAQDNARRYQSRCTQREYLTAPRLERRPIHRESLRL